jgi:hypothetical protein
MKLSQTFHQLKERSSTQELTIQQIVDMLADKGHALIMTVFTIPFLQPIPTMGLSAPFGLMISIIGFCMMIHVPPWVPLKFRQMKVNRDLLHRSSEVAEKVFLKIEKLIKPRWPIFQSQIFHRWTGFLILINGFLLSLPLPIPGTNSAPAWSLLILGLSEIEEDGALTLIGYLASLGTLIFFATLAWGAQAGLQELLRST